MNKSGALEPFVTFLNILCPYSFSMQLLAHGLWGAYFWRADSGFIAALQGRCGMYLHTPHRTPYPGSWLVSLGWLRRVGPRPSTSKPALAIASG